MFQFMRFMKQVGDGQINLEEGALERDSQSWSDEYVNTTAKQDGDALAQSWANELATNNGKLYLKYHQTVNCSKLMFLQKMASIRNFGISFKTNGKN